MKRSWFKIAEPKTRLIELTDDDDGKLTLVAWQRKRGRFAAVTLDPGDVKQLRDALDTWLYAMGGPRPEGR